MGVADPASIATSIAIGSSLLGGVISMVVALRSPKGAAVNHDIVVSILFGVAVLLIMLNMIAVARIALWGMAYIGLEKAALLLTAAFAVSGLVCGLMRGLRSGRQVKTLST